MSERVLTRLVVFYANNIGVYYFHAPSGSPELDFVTVYNGETTIIECKSTNNRPTSMKYVIANPQKYGKHNAIKLADTNVGGGEGFKTLPLYSLGFIRELQPDVKVPSIDFSKLCVNKNCQ